MPSQMQGDPNSVPQEVTVLLQAWTEGDAAALAKLTPLIYSEMRRLAQHYMARERSSPTLARRPWKAARFNRRRPTFT